MKHDTPETARYDVVVVGGGPGGTAAAIRCAGAGLSVALVEREPFPRERVGETLHPGVEPLLEQLGVADSVRGAGFVRHEGNWVERDGEARFAPFGSGAAGPWRGFQAWRAEFDSILLGRARELGTAVFQPCRAARPLIESGRVVGVETSGGPLESSFLVDAAGGNHWLARRLGLSVENHSPPLTARYGYVEGACPEEDGAPTIRVDPDGWTWTARVRPNLYQWTRLSLRSGPTGRPDAFRGLKSRRGPRAADVTWRVISRPAGKGYFLTGDAAAVLDPASSHGVLRAVMTGMMAAHLMVQVLRRGADERVTALAYARWLRAWFESDAKELKKFYGPLMRPLRPREDSRG